MNTRNLLTDIAGLKVGNAQDNKLKSGVTAILCDAPCIASYYAMGGAPGTRETDLLDPQNTVQHVNALFLSGGSAFGLDAATGITAHLREKKIGFSVGEHIIPIVPGAILFDLENGGKKDWGKYPPYRELGYKAANAASIGFELGSMGAGCGATVAGLKGGLGSASIELNNGIKVAALVAVNALGSPTIGPNGHFWAAPFEQNDEFGGFGFPNPMPSDASQVNTKLNPQSGTNTTIAVVATDAKLTKAEAKRLALASHDGFARALYPVHTPLDGDIIFSLATGANELSSELIDWTELCAQGANVMSRAIARAIYEATPAKNDIFPCWKEKYGAKLKS